MRTWKGNEKTDDKIIAVGQRLPARKIRRMKKWGIASMP
jgi:hypothetical protein